MKTAGIIAEYNPFHHGHAYHIAQTRAMGFDHIVCVMSGNFVQRGDVAVATKWARTAMALKNGADLVIELPLTFALAPAERFARGAIALLHSLGCVDAVSFGSETGNLDVLQKMANRIDSGRLDDTIRHLLTTGISYAAARQKAMESEFGEEAGCLSNPNDTLGIEYLRALARYSCEMRPIAIPRRGARHDECAQRDGMVSASCLREQWKTQTAVKKAAPALDDLPEQCRDILSSEYAAGRFPIYLCGMESVILGVLRGKQKIHYTQLPDCSEGLENRLWHAVREGCSLNEIFELAKTKRYPLARIRRLCLSLALGISADDWMDFPSYLRVLGIGPRGIALLQAMEPNAQIPVITKTRDITSLGAEARRQFELECLSTDLYTLAFPCPLPCGSDQRHKLIVLS